MAGLPGADLAPKEPVWRGVPTELHGGMRRGAESRRAQQVPAGGRLFPRSPQGLSCAHWRARRAWRIIPVANGPPSRRPEIAPLATLDSVQEARGRIGARLHRTPVLSSRRLSRQAGVPLRLKMESLQKTGSFKVRGALNKVLVAGPAARHGVVTVSAGNHAQALAWAAGCVDVPCAVVMPAGASETKARASAGYGAEVVIADDVHQAFALAESLARDRGMLFTHPFDDLAVIAGHGTAGLELAEQAGELDVVVVPLGGGGLIAGVAAAMRGLRPGLRIFGVEPRGAAAMSESLRIGRPAHLERVGSIADGLAAPMAGEITYAHVRALVDDVVRVSDVEITAAVRALAESTKMVVEPAGAAGVAALLCGRIPDVGAGPAGVIVSGGNVDLSLLAEIFDPGRGPGASDAA